MTHDRRTPVTSFAPNLQRRLGVRGAWCVVALAIAAAFTLRVGPAQAGTRVDALSRGLEALVRAPGGPPGVIATLYRDGRLTVLSAGRANVARPRAPRPGDHMRLASVAKAFNGAV